MSNRVFTVGSLIPGSTIVMQVSPPVVAKSEKPQLEKIIVQQNGSKFEILPVKGNLLNAALNQGKAIQYKCRKGTCGQCTVKVVQGSGLSKPNEKELSKLKNEINNGFRLACQVEIR
jgi:ferredoxin, 2Fe-2S